MLEQRITFYAQLTPLIHDLVIRIGLSREEGTTGKMSNFHKNIDVTSSRSSLLEYRYLSSTPRRFKIFFEKVHAAAYLKILFKQETENNLYYIFGFHTINFYWNKVCRY